MTRRVLALTTSGLFAVAACSLVVERGAEQCHTDRDCLQRGPLFANRACAPDHTCQPMVVDAGDADGDDAGPRRECTHNEECISRAAGAPAICRKDTFTCVPVVGSGCESVRSFTAAGSTLEGADAVRDDDTVLMGSLVGIEAPPDGPRERSFARAQAAELAVFELMTTAGGLPPAPGGTKRRPVAVVSCNDYEVNSPPPPVQAAQLSAAHLSALGVPGVMGANTSGNTNLVLSYLPKKGVFLIAPTATSAALTNIDDDGLFFRTAPSDVVQVVPLGELIKAAAPEDSEKKVFVMYTADAYGTGLYEAALPKLQRHGVPITNQANQAFLKATPYPTEATADLSSFVSQALSFRPDVVVLLGTSFAVANFVVPLERQWGPGPRPFYIGSDSYKGASAAITADEVDGGIGSVPSFRERFEGTAPGRATATTQSFLIRFEPRYGSRYSTVFGTANAYDGAYVILYALAASSSKPVSGVSIAEGVRKLVGGNQVFDVGPRDMNTVLSALASGESIDLNGASGPLDFDAHGDVLADIEVWCVQHAPNPPTFISTALYYNSATRELEGAHSPGSCP